MSGDKKYSINFTEGCIDCPNIKSRIGDNLAHYAYKAGRDLGLELYESDIQWIENHIIKNSQNRNRDIFWQIEDYIVGHQKYSSPYFRDYYASFFEVFIDTPGIPNNVNRLLIYVVGIVRAWYRKQKTMPYQHFLVESWLRKTQKGR